MAAKNPWKRIAETLDTIENVLGQAAKYHVDRWLRTRTDAQINTMSKSMSFGWRGIGSENQDKTARRSRSRGLILIANVRGQLARVATFKGWRKTKTVNQLDIEINNLWAPYHPPAHQDPAPVCPPAAARNWHTRLIQDRLDFLAHIAVMPPHDGETIVPNAVHDFTSCQIVAHGVQHTVIRPFVDQTFRTIRPRNNNHLHALPIYWLPWNNRHIVHLHLAAGVNSPRFFFTSAIGGCSVFVRGPANHPTVYHAGCETGQLTNYKDYAGPRPRTPQVTALCQAAQAGDAPLFWHLLMEKNHNVVVAPPNWGEVDKRDYVKDGSVYRGVDCTVRVLSFIKRVEGIHEDEGLKISEIRPSGCVFGIKTGANWDFYLQENVAITYQLTKVQGRPRFRAGLPFELHKIWPVPAQRISLVPKCCRMPWLFAAGDSVVGL